ncbi:unannotated protein [freshwater metagenome]|uniref:Unannotated protein n=1 Tax=freshwater metagenome TaxID=449393 RepID=A0A6J7JEP0_9ZZZZ
MTPPAMPAAPPPVPTASTGAADGPLPARPRRAAGTAVRGALRPRRPRPSAVRGPAAGTEVVR